MKNARNETFKELFAVKENHKEVKHIKNKTLEMQSYLQSDNTFIKEVLTITALKI